VKKLQEREWKCKIEYRKKTQKNDAWYSRKKNMKDHNAELRLKQEETKKHQVHSSQMQGKREMKNLGEQSSMTKALTES